MMVDSDGKPMAPKRIRIRFDGPPGHEPGRFVEVEDADSGAGISWGEWSEEDSTGHWFLTFDNVEEKVREFIGLCIAFYYSQSIDPTATETWARRRRGQIIALAEVLRFLDGTQTTVEELREYGLIPLTIDDLPTNLGGTVEEDRG